MRMLTHFEHYSKIKRKMKRKSLKNLSLLALICAIFTIFIISSCEKEQIDSHTSELIKEETTNRQVSSVQAKAFASMIANNIFSSEDNGAQLKSATADAVRTVEDVQAIVYKSDTVMFSMNFGNNKGFILISGDKEDSPIVALSDLGAFDMNNLNPTITIWLESQKQFIAQQMKEPFQDDEDNLWNSMENDSSQIEYEFVGNLPELKSCPTGEEPSGRTTVYPSTGMSNKWGQGSGYNFDAKVSGALVGCPALSIGQLCRDQRFPDDYNYSGMPNELSSYYNTHSSYISKMLRGIADKIPSYSWSSSGSGASPSNILTGLKRLGYSNAQLKNYNLVTAYNNLKQGVPVLFGAYQNGGYSGGHIWFCDGYYEAKVKITHKKWRPFKWRVHCVVYQYRDYLYMNWGWNGDHNGWFRSDTGSWEPGSANFNSHRKMYVNLSPVR